MAIANVVGADKSSIARLQAGLPVHGRTLELIDAAFDTLGDDLGLTLELRPRAGTRSLGHLRLVAPSEPLDAESSEP